MEFKRLQLVDVEYAEMNKPDPMTQSERILAYLRKHKTATNMELVQRLWIASPWKRIQDLVVQYWRSSGDMLRAHDQVSDMECITRTTIKTKSGKRVTQYRLERI